MGLKTFLVLCHCENAGNLFCQVKYFFEGYMRCVIYGKVRVGVERYVFVPNCTVRASRFGA